MLDEVNPRYSARSDARARGELACCLQSIERLNQRR
jgi:hypothetical protein